MLKLRAEMDDEKVRQFFRRINSEVVSVIPPARKMKVGRATKASGFRMGPILRIAEDLSLFDHVEDPAVRTVLYPEFVSGFRVARRGEKIRHARNGSELTYAADAAGNCRYTFRHSSRSDAARGGAAGRAKGAKDVGQHIEPTVYIEKYEPSTGAIIDDDQMEGHWRAFMVTFPLRETVRGVHVAEVAYPIPASPYSDWMTDQERDVRNQGMQKRGAQPGADVT